MFHQRKGQNGIDDNFCFCFCLFVSVRLCDYHILSSSALNLTSAESSLSANIRCISRSFVVLFVAIVIVIIGITIDYHWPEALCIWLLHLLWKITEKIKSTLAKV